MITFLLLATAVAFYVYFTRSFHYWQDRGIKHDKPLPIFGNTLSYFLVRKSFVEIAEKLYSKYPNEKVVGFYHASRPALIIRDPEIVKRILVTDFFNFHARGMNTHNEPLLRNVIFADGDLWRLLRKTISPVFSSSRLRAMFSQVDVCARQLATRALFAAPSSLNARDLLARYTTDCVSACSFSFHAGSLSNEHAFMRKLNIKIAKVRFMDAIIGICKSLCPEIFKHLKHYGKVETDMHNLVEQILEQRNNKPSARNDLIDILLECKKQGLIIGESFEKMKPNGSPEQATLEMTDELLTAQVFMFFGAAYEASSSAASITLHQLAYHPDVQRKVQEEVDSVLAKYDNKICYDAIKDMKYLEWTFMETMRIFPSVALIRRMCTRKCTIPEIGVDLDSGVVIAISVRALHNDPRYFQNPEEFRPERFHPDQIDANNKYTYLPFGDGPRGCLGARMGLMLSMAGLAAVLQRCSVTPAPETLRHPRVDPTGNIHQNFSNGLPLIFHQRTNYAKNIEHFD